MLYVRAASLEEVSKPLRYTLSNEVDKAQDYLLTIILQVPTFEW